MGDKHYRVIARSDGVKCWACGVGNQESKCRNSLGEFGRQVERMRESAFLGVRASGTSILVFAWNFASAQKSFNLDDSVSEQIIKQWFIYFTHMFVHLLSKYLLSPFYIVGPNLNTKDI